MNILILGASYGSLLGTKMALAGHNVHLVCLPEEANAINSDGVLLRLPTRGRDEPVEICSRDLPGTVSAGSPGDVRIGDYDLTALAMQEPQYRFPEISELLGQIAEAGVPCISIMNMPPLPYLRRIPGLDTESLRDCYTEPAVWDDFNPELFTLCSPDPQAFRPPGEPVNVLQVTLPTNFKAARFGNSNHNHLLETLDRDTNTRTWPVDDHDIVLPVKLKLHESIFVPTAKWAMLLTGNYRCVQSDGVRSISEAVHNDIDASREIYNWVCDMCIRLGASPSDMVPFEKYANAAQGLLKPSSAARALAANASFIERVDRLVQRIGVQHGMAHPEIDRTVSLVDSWLQKNSKAA